MDECATYVDDAVATQLNAYFTNNLIELSKILNIDEKQLFDCDINIFHIQNKFNIFKI